MANPFHPERFQGSLRRRDYFEGWYFKLSDHAGARGLAVIAGVALGGPGQAFVQVLEGEGHSSFTAQWTLQAFRTARRRFAVEIADNHFDGDGLALHIDQNGHSLRGTLRFLHPIPFPAQAGRASWGPTASCQAWNAAMPSSASGIRWRVPLRWTAGPSS